MSSVEPQSPRTSPKIWKPAAPPRKGGKNEPPRGRPAAALVHVVRQDPAPRPYQGSLGRMIAWRIQEKFYGGHDKAHASL